MLYKYINLIHWQQTSVQGSASPPASEIFVNKYGSVFLVTIRQASQPVKCNNEFEETPTHNQ